MKLDRNPKRVRGNRNVLCMHYDKCLWDAARQKWDFWDCGACCHQADRGGELVAQLATNDAFDTFPVPDHIYQQVS